MKSLFSTYAASLRSVADPKDGRLLMERHEDMEVYYAPFDHVNAAARVVIVGITPGHQQAAAALQAAKSALARGLPESEAARVAKETASFSGPMRSNLVAMLDYFGLNAVLGLGSCASLFGTAASLVHHTSVLRYPVFRAGKNYSGTPSPSAHPFLRKQLWAWFAEEMRALPDAIYVPLGSKVAEAVESVAREVGLRPDRILTGLQHPSGANAERVAYLLGRKARESLSAKTSAAGIDAARDKLRHQVASLAS